MQEPEYLNQIGEVPVGETYESVKIPNVGTIMQGDIVVWSDPDCHYHDESVMESLYIGTVNKVYKRDEPELGTSLPVGRLSIDQNMKAISGLRINRNIDGASAKFVDQFLNSDHEKYMNIEWTRSGDVRVSGE
jgi:hypothetical protein